MVLPLLNDSWPNWLISVNRLVTSSMTGEWCKLSYPGHKNGCPNYDRKGCPPNAKSIDKIIDTSKKMYIVHSEFDLDKHIKNMKQKHSSWSDRQLRNVLYWQGTSRKQLRLRVWDAQFMYIGGEHKVELYCPEAHGVNVYATCALHGLHLDKIRSLHICRHVALLGSICENTKNSNKA